MRHLRILAAAALAAVVFVSSAEAAVKVSFIAPERYNDRDFRFPERRNGLLKEFREIFDRLGGRYLKPGQTLEIQVLNIRLAGEYEPWRTGFDEVRILRDVTPPRVRLRYTLREGGKVLRRGEEVVSDMNYLMRSTPRLPIGRLEHEKDMLRSWFRARFASRD